MNKPRTFPDLTKAPLSFVLCQVKFSPVPKMDEAMLGEIFARLRKAGFPDDLSGEIKQVIILHPGMLPQESTVKLQEYRSADGAWALNVSRDQVAIFTTKYTHFGELWTKLEDALRIVSEVAELGVGTTKRVGLRMIDVINPKDGESWKNYLKPHFAGLDSSKLDGDKQRIYLEFVSPSENGTFVLKILQNSQDMHIPPDIMMLQPMPKAHQDTAGRDITLLDSDHFWEGSVPFGIDTIKDRLAKLHEDMNAIWFDDIISETALKTWT